MLYLLSETFLKILFKKTLDYCAPLNGEILEETMSTKRRRVDRDVFYESRKPVYVMSDLYQDISSEEDLNHDDRKLGKETGFDLLDDISLDNFPDVDEDFISNIVGDTDGDIRCVTYSEMPIAGE